MSPGRVAGSPRRRERRQSAAEQVLRTRSADVHFTGIEGRLQETLDAVEAESESVDKHWRRLMRVLAPSRSQFEDVAALRLGMHRRHLRTKDYTSYAEAIEREARVLMARGVSEEHAIMALAFRLECSLAGLLHDDLHEKSFALTLARVTSGVQRFLLSGYASARAAGWHQADEVERKKLSQDLHDEVGADLVVLKLYIEMIALELRRDRLEVARAKLEEALALVSHALESVRRLTLDLGPAILEQLGLIPALKLYCRQFAGRTGIAVKVEGAEIPASLPHGHETTLYRVLQGALSNVAKHSKARHVRVALGGLRDSVLVMVIEDDGIGFDVPAEARHGGFGLTAMRDRILALGGRLHIESRLASGGGRKGTRIEIDLPASPDRGLP